MPETSNFFIPLVEVLASESGNIFSAIQDFTPKGIRQVGSQRLQTEYPFLGSMCKNVEGCRQERRPPAKCHLPFPRVKYLCTNKYPDSKA